MTGASRALLDTGALVALLHREDDAHDSVTDSLGAYRVLLQVTTEALLAESMDLLGHTRGGQEACLGFFIRGAATLVPSSRSSLVRCREIMAQYADLPADFADATLISLSEEARTLTIITLDLRGFSTYRDRHGGRFEVRP